MRTTDGPIMMMVTHSQAALALTDGRGPPGTTVT
jgi:hypothetical protein